MCPTIIVRYMRDTFMTRVMTLLCREWRDPNHDLGDRVTMRRLLYLLMFTAAPLLHAVALAQTGVPRSAPGINTNRITSQTDGEKIGIRRQRDPLGKPCLDYIAVSRRHLANANVYDHVITINNHCLRPIKLRVCYFKTVTCIDSEVPSLKYKEIILGIYPSMPYFRYSYEEKF